MLDVITVERGCRFFADRLRRASHRVIRVERMSFPPASASPDGMGEDCCRARSRGSVLRFRNIVRVKYLAVVRPARYLLKSAVEVDLRYIPSPPPAVHLRDENEIRNLKKRSFAGEELSEAAKSLFPPRDL